MSENECFIWLMSFLDNVAFPFITAFNWLWIWNSSVMGPQIKESWLQIHIRWGNNIHYFCKSKDIIISLVQSSFSKNLINAFSLGNLWTAIKHTNIFCIVTYSQSSKNIKKSLSHPSHLAIQFSYPRYQCYQFFVYFCRGILYIYKQINKHCIFYFI